MPVSSTIRSSADWSSGSPPFSVTVLAIISLPKRLPEPISVLSSHSGTDIRSSRAVPAAVFISCAALRNAGKPTSCQSAFASAYVYSWPSMKNTSSPRRRSPPLTTTCFSPRRDASLRIAVWSLLRNDPPCSVTSPPSK